MSEEDLDGRGEIDGIASDLSDEDRSQVLDFLMNDKSPRRSSGSRSDNPKDKKQEGSGKNHAPKLLSRIACCPHLLEAVVIFRAQTPLPVYCN